MKQELGKSWDQTFVKQELGMKSNEVENRWLFFWEFYKLVDSLKLGEKKSQRTRQFRNYILKIEINSFKTKVRIVQHWWNYSDLKCMSKWLL